MATPDADYVRGAREALAEVGRRMAQALPSVKLEDIRLILRDAAAELGVDEDAPSTLEAARIIGEALAARNEEAPSGPLSATQAAQEPSAGGNGWAKALTALSGRFEISAELHRAGFQLRLIHTGCPDHWTAVVDDLADLAELVRRAGEHGEVCR